MKFKFKSLFFTGLLAFALGVGVFAGIKASNNEVIVDAVEAVKIVSVGGNPIEHEDDPSYLVKADFPLGYVGKPYSAQLVASGGSGEYLWKIDIGSFPKGVTLNESTGLVSGTPTHVANGSMTITVRDKNNLSNSYNCVLGINFINESDAPKITTTTLDNGILNNDYGCYVDIAGLNIFTMNWSVSSGSLPPGLEIGGSYHGFIGGRPTVTGTYNFTLKVDSKIGSDEHSYTIVVEPKVTVSYNEKLTYYNGDTVQMTSSIGVDNVYWRVSDNTSSKTTISSSGLLKIGEDETSSSIYVIATSKINDFNNSGTSVDINNNVPHTITIIDGYAMISSDPITRAAVGEGITIIPNEIDGKVFVYWSVEEGSASVDFFGDETEQYNFFYMPEGDVIIKANYVEIIDTVVISFAKPVNGNTVDINIVTGSSNYTASFYQVLVNENYVEIEDIVYETDVTYSFYFEFEATPGYKLIDPISSLTVIVNGETLRYGANYYDRHWYVSYVAASDETPFYNVNVVNGTADLTLAHEGDLVTITAKDPEEGYAFSKWTTSDVSLANANNVVTTFTMPAKEVTITATYRELVMYKVSFDPNGGSGVMSEINVTAGSEYTLPACSFAAPINKYFSCWSVNGVNKNVGDIVVINKDTTVKAIWAGRTSTIVFLAGEGSGSMADVTVDTGSTYTLPECRFVAPEGKQFKAWSVNGVELIPGNEIVVDRDVTITALYVDKIVPPTPSGSSGNSGLSVGAIVGIAIGGAVVVGLGVFALIWFVIKKKSFADLIGIFKKK